MREVAAKAGGEEGLEGEGLLIVRTPKGWSVLKARFQGRTILDPELFRGPTSLGEALLNYRIAAGELFGRLRNAKPGDQS